MSLQRRLLLYLLLCAPLVWGIAFYFSIDRARDQVNELFDTELIRLARQVQSTLGPAFSDGTASLAPAPTEGSSGAGESDVRDLAVAVWDRGGRLMLADREGAVLPMRLDRSGFFDEPVDGRPWRVYYMQSVDGRWVVAAGQASYERNELVYGLIVSQVLPWILVLPVLLVTMAWAVRRALAPIAGLTAELKKRGADELQPIPDRGTPIELKPMLGAINGLFTRIDALLVRERRFTADAAHELRTPLAILRAQWDVVRRAVSPAERTLAEEKLDAGIDRMGRLVTQMLALSRVESASLPMRKEVDWPPIVEEAMGSCMLLAQRRDIELSCEWPSVGKYPMPLMGDENLLSVLLRNLLDNAVRYAPAGTHVVLRFTQETIEVENDGAPLDPAQLQRLGERFYRPDGQQEGGSGLGVSIARRIAELHGLVMEFGTASDGRGVRVRLMFATARPITA